MIRIRRKLNPPILKKKEKTTDFREEKRKRDKIYYDKTGLTQR